jgi:hypothetical protein
LVRSGFFDDPTERPEFQSAPDIDERTSPAAPRSVDGLFQSSAFAGDRREALRQMDALELGSTRRFVTGRAKFGMAGIVNRQR